MSNVKPSQSGKLLDSDTWDALLKQGYTQEELLADQPTGPIIFSYSRAQAIEDGVLVDVTEMAKAAGFTIHTVITDSVMAEIGAAVRSIFPNDPEKVPAQTKLMVFKLLQYLHFLVKTAKGEGAELHFKFIIQPAASLALWALVGPGDDPKPVLTIMREGED